MDKLKGLAEKAMHSGGDKSSSATSDGATGTQGSAGQEDYADKGMCYRREDLVAFSSSVRPLTNNLAGVAAAEKRFGIAGNRERDEKYTDMAREQYEKQTGSKVNSKFSN